MRNGPKRACEVDVMDTLSIKGFHEQPEEIRSKVYTRESGTGVSYISNVDLFQSKAASWRDTIQLRMGPTPPAPELIPEICRKEVVDVEHRVLANSSGEPRVSIAVFFNPGKREELYGPLPELVSPEKPAHFRQFTLSEFLGRFFTKELDGKSLKNYFRQETE
ncbi:hypothetical protein FEM48_Zijuj10G0119200 [Ziziphus jujuba var. spinosa]|uniref:Uncharacterized protein n=1 Tax=Ziziphus jujuba var. spinosa TaxID=714518 RepID=A0A978UN84_ZIZJJ|nr:hypothetical protein FEM48_Zijuj10G0119200 [Ziziphus jujuba var. spinosa]